MKPAQTASSQGDHSQLPQFLIQIQCPLIYYWELHTGRQACSALKPECSLKCRGSVPLRKAARPNMPHDMIFTTCVILSPSLANEIVALLTFSRNHFLTQRQNSIAQLIPNKQQLPFHVPIQKELSPHRGVNIAWESPLQPDTPLPHWFHLYYVTDHTY